MNAHMPTVSYPEWISLCLVRDKRRQKIVARRNRWHFHFNTHTTRLLIHARLTSNTISPCGISVPVLYSPIAIS